MLPGPQGATGPPGTPDTSSVYTKAQSDARLLGIAAKAADAERLDGLDSTAFARVYLALVEPDGTLSGGKGFASVTRVGTGAYLLKLAQVPRTTCAAFATLEAGTSPIGQISADGPAGDGTMVNVWTANGTGALADRGFQVALIC